MYWRNCATLTLAASCVLLVAGQGCGSKSVVHSIAKPSYVSAQMAAVSSVTGKSFQAGIHVEDSGCDVCDAVACLDNCGHNCCAPPAPSPSTCGAPGQCPCSLGTSALIGYCGSRPPAQVCTYCPSGTWLADACGTECQVVNPTSAPPPQDTHCPGSYPVSCGGANTCCPSSHGVCCPGGATCGVTQDDCNSDQPWYEQHSSGGGSASAGGGGSGGSGGSGCGQATCPSGLARATLRPGCCSTGACPSSCADDCGNVWYEARGNLYGPCSSSDTGCVMNAAQAAIPACQ